jgi:hypothetical protein
LRGGDYATSFEIKRSRGGVRKIRARKELNPVKLVYNLVITALNKGHAMVVYKSASFRDLANSVLQTATLV